MGILRYGRRGMDCSGMDAWSVSYAVVLCVYLLGASRVSLFVWLLIFKSGGNMSRYQELQTEPKLAIATLLYLITVTP